MLVSDERIRKAIVTETKKNDFVRVGGRIFWFLRPRNCQNDRKNVRAIAIIFQK